MVSKVQSTQSSTPSPKENRPVQSVNKPSSIHAATKAIQETQVKAEGQLIVEKKITSEPPSQTLIGTTTPEQAEAVKAHYEKMIQAYEEKEGGFITKAGGIKTGLTPATLLKVIETALTTKQPFVHATQEHTYHVEYNKDKGEVELLYLEKKLGKGTFGSVYEIVDAQKGTREAVKFARKYPHLRVNPGINLTPAELPKAQKKAKKDVKNEYRIRSAVHAKGNVWGVQAKPRRVIHFLTQSKKDPTQLKVKEGFINTKYEDTYFDHHAKTLPFKDRLFEFHQLVAGLKSLSERGILHGDIKPDNILMLRQPDGTQLVHIADLGGARQVTSDQKSLDSLVGADRSYTAGYSPLDDLLLSRKIIKEVHELERQVQEMEKKGDRKNLNTLRQAYQEKREQLIELEKKRDVFSIGTILYTALTGLMPFPDDYRVPGESFPNASSPYTPISRGDVPLEFNEFIKKMLHPDYKQRPSPEEAFAVLDRFIKEKHPDVAALIQSKIHGNYLPPETFKLQLDPKMRSASEAEQFAHLKTLGLVVENKEEALKVLADAPIGKFVIWKSQNKNMPNTYGFLQRTQLTPPTLAQALRLVSFTPSNLLYQVERLFNTAKA